jgi:hypothetical protein
MDMVSVLFGGAVILHPFAGHGQVRLLKVLESAGAAFPSVETIVTMIATAYIPIQ